MCTCLLLARIGFSKHIYVPSFFLDKLQFHETACLCQKSICTYIYIDIDICIYIALLNIISLLNFFLLKIVCNNVLKLNLFLLYSLYICYADFNNEEIVSYINIINPPLYNISINIYLASLSKISMLLVCSHERLRLIDLAKRKTSSRFVSLRTSVSNKVISLTTKRENNSKT